MRRSDKAGGKTAKTQRHRTLKRRNALKAERPHKSFAAGEETEVARLRRELNEALEQQTATSEVLKVISGSPGDLEPVFNAMLENAVRLCEANNGNLFLYDGEAFHTAALQRASQAYAAARRRPIVVRELHPDVPLARIVQTKEVIHIADIMTAQCYIEREPQIIALVEAAGARTLLFVPIVKENKLVGAFAIYRQEVRPFSDKQIELVQNFAAQAVIAIENTRLLNELRRRTDDLTESLEQQTASGEILASISGSLTDTKPVFDAIVRNLLRLFGSRWACVQVLHDGIVHMPAIDGEAGSKKLIDYYPQPLDENTVGGRAMQSKQVLQFSEIENNSAVPLTTQQFAREFGFRSAIFAPMIRDNRVIGAIGVANFKPKVFNDKQVALIKAFADQAVIAIENTRLLNELRESLEQQTATSEVLQVISSSPGELEPVFNSMLSSATRLCDASFGTLLLWEGDAFRMAAVHGDLPPAVKEKWQPGILVRPGPDVPVMRAGLTRNVVQVADLREEFLLPQWRAPACFSG